MSKEKIICDDINLMPLLKAKQAFDIAIEAPKTDLHRDATIQRFEFTFELCWKTLKRVLKYQGIIANNPRDVFRQSAKQNLIENPVIWFEFLEHRNRTTHVYNEIDAEQIYSALPDFKIVAEQLLETLKSL